MPTKLAGAFETTVVFLFFLFVWMLGALLAAKYFIGPIIQPQAQSLSTVMQAA